MSEMTLNVNGQRIRVDAPNDESLLSVLRNRLELTGTKYGCGEGECGACTVLLNGEPRRSCRIAARDASGVRVTTIEGLAPDGKLNPVQAAFLEYGAFQCGYCTPGMILAATALLAGNRHPTDQQIVTAMNGNLCRCGTYPRIVAAIQRAAEIAAQGGRP